MKIHYYTIILENEIIRQDFVIDWNDLPVMPYRIKYYGQALYLPQIPDASLLNNCDFGFYLKGEYFSSDFEV